MKNNVTDKLKIPQEMVEMLNIWYEKLKTQPDKLPLLTEFMKEFGYEKECKDGNVESTLTSLNGGKWHIPDDMWFPFSICLINSLRRSANISLQEIARQNDIVRPFLDIESKTDRVVTDNDINKIIDLFLRMYWRLYDKEKAIQLNKDKWDTDHKSNVIVLRNENDPQRRVHIHFPSLIIDVKILRFIAKSIMESYDDLNEIIDCNLNGLRLVYCCKKDNILSVYRPSQNLDDDAILYLYKCRIRAFEWESTPPLNQEYTQTFENFGNDRTELEEIDDVMINNISKHVDMENFHPIKEGGSIRLIRKRPSKCVICKRIHENDNMMVYSRSGHVSLRCFRGQKSIKLFKVRDLTEAEKEARRKYYLDKLLKAKASFVPPPYLVVDTYDSPYVKEIQFDHTIEMIMSRMESGKTTVLKNYIKKHLKELGSVLILSSKRSYAVFITMCLQTGLPEIKIFNYMTDIIEYQDYVVLQAESMFRINKSYMLVVIDEMTSFLKQMNSKLHGNNLSYNREKLEHVIKDAKRIICMDADIDERCYGFIHKLRPNDEIHLQRNLNKKGQRKVVIFKKNQENECWKIMYDLIQQGKNINIILGSHNYGKDLESQFNSKGINYLFLNSEQQINPKLKELKQEFISKGIDKDPDITDLWSKYQVVMFTSTVTVGIDYNVPHFDVQFVYGNSKGVCVRDIKQMMGRCRILKDNLIYVCNDVVREFCYTTFEDVKFDLNERSKLNNKLALEYLTHDERQLHLIDGKYMYVLKDTLWSWLAVHNMLEDNISKSYYDEIFKLMIQNQGYEITNYESVPQIKNTSPSNDNTLSVEINTNDTNNQDKKITSDSNETVSDNKLYDSEVFDDVEKFKKYKKELREQVKNNEIELIRNAPIVSQKELNSMEKQIEKGEADKITIKTVQKNKVLKRLPEDQRDKMTAEEISDVMKTNPLLWHASVELNMTVKDQLFIDLNNTEKTPLFSKLHYINYICSVLKVNNTLDRNTEIPCSRIRDNFVDLLALFNNISVVFGIKCKKPEDFGTMKRFIDDVLRRWTGCTLSDKWGDKKHVIKGSIKFSDYKKQLLEKYNVDDIDKVPQYEWIKYADREEAYIIRSCSYIYKLKPPTLSFDSYLERINYSSGKPDLNNIYNENNTDSVQLTDKIPDEFIISDKSSFKLTVKKLTPAIIQNNIAKTHISIPDFLNVINNNHKKITIPNVKF